MADDPYDFENDDYEESSTPNFEPSFMLNFERTDKEQATQIFGERKHVCVGRSCCPVEIRQL